MLRCFCNAARAPSASPSRSMTVSLFKHDWEREPSRDHRPYLRKFWDGGAVDCKQSKIVLFSNKEENAEKMLQLLTLRSNGAWEE